MYDCASVAWWVAYQNLVPTIYDRFPRGQETNLVFNSDIVSFLFSVKNQWGSDRKPNFIIFLV